MKKLLMLAVLLILALGALAAPAAATPVTDLTALASYYSDQVPVFMAFRTDDALFDELDALKDKIGASLPAGSVSNQGFSKGRRATTSPGSRALNHFAATVGWGLCGRAPTWLRLRRSPRKRGGR